MLFTIKREDLFYNLQSSVNVIEKKQTMPILSNVLLKAGEENLLMTSTDMEIQLEAKMPAQVQRVGETTISARKFFDICRSLPEKATIKMEMKNDQVQIQTGRTRFRLSSLDPKKFPSFSIDPYDVELEIDGQKLMNVLQSTSFCMATQDVRYYLNGIMIEFDQTRIGTVASNGHRLAMNTVDLEQSTNVHTQVILPRKGANELIRLIGSKDEQILKLKASNSNFEVKIGDTVFLSKLIDGKYPDFKAALSQPIAHRFRLNTIELKNALSRVSVLSHEKFKKITLDFSTNVFVIKTDNQDQEQAMEELDIDYEGDPYEISVNVSYLLEAVNFIDTDFVSLSFTKETNICLITVPDDPNLTYVVMPLK